MRNLILFVLAGLLVFALCQFSSRGAATPEVSGLPGASAPQVDSGAVEVDPLTQVPLGSERESAEALGAGSETRPVVAADLHPWEGAFAGLRGRVVEEDGSPVGNMNVELAEIGFAFLLKPEQRVTGREGIRLARTKTGPNGVFEMAGARPAEYHALAVDGGGPRSTLRVLEHSLS